MSEAGTKFEINSDVINQHILPSKEPQVKADLMLEPDEIPTWLNELFFQDAMRKYFGDKNLRVKSLKIQSCGGKGDSYASVMYRVGVFYSRGQNSDQVLFKSYVVKTLPELEVAVEKLGSNNFNVQNKEMEIYQRFLPEFRKILESINEDASIFPDVLTVDKALEVIVLEDLAEKKFVMCDRLKGLDLDHILLALRKLARLHAASVIVHDRDPNAFAHIDTGFYTRKTEAFHVMFETLCDALIEESATWEGFEYYANKLKSVRKSLIERAQRTFDCDEGDFHVLNHGDLWTNNLLYAYDEAGKAADAVLLDFQFASLGSPVLDLMVRIFFQTWKLFINCLFLSKYLLYTSTVDDLRVDRMDDLFQFYYYEMKSLLSRLSYDMKKFPSFHNFQMQILKKYFYGRSQRN